MSMILSKTSTNWKPAPAGKWQAVCVDVRNEGFHPNPFNDNKPTHKISVHFQLNAPRDEEGRLPMISKWFTYSLNEKSALAGFLCEWFECGFSAIPESMNLESLVGQNARIRVINEPKQDGSGTRAIIQSIEGWDGDAMAPDNFTRKPGQGDLPPDQQHQQAFAPNPSQPLPPTNRMPQQQPAQSYRPPSTLQPVQQTQRIEQRPASAPDPMAEYNNLCRELTAMGLPTGEKPKSGQAFLEWREWALQSMKAANADPFADEDTSDPFAD